MERRAQQNSGRGDGDARTPIAGLHDAGDSAAGRRRKRGQGRKSGESRVESDENERMRGENGEEG